MQTEFIIILNFQFSILNSNNMRAIFSILLLVCSLGLHAQSQKALRDSLAVASDSLAFHPDSIDLRLKKAAWNLQLEQWEYARAEYDYVLKLDDRNVAALYYRAYVNEKLRRYKFARLDYQNLLTIVPGNFEASLGLALLNQKDKHYTEALDMLNALCDHFPNKSEAFAARAGVEVERNMYELAEYDYSQAFALEPSNTDYLLARADVRLKMNHKLEAREDLDQLVRMGVSKPTLSKLYKLTK